MLINKKMAKELIALAEKEIKESENLIDVFQTNLKYAEERVQRYAFVKTIGNLNYLSQDKIQSVFRKFQERLIREKDSEKNFIDKINAEQIRIKELQYFVKKIKDFFP